MEDSNIKAASAHSTTTAERVLNGGLLLAILALLATKLQLLSTLNINWDEFLFASKIYAFERGELTSQLQSFHVHLFGWIRAAGNNGVDQIIAAREFMFGLRLLTCACIFLIGRRLFGTTGALVAVAASMAFSYVIMHGESFRADPLITSCFMVAASLLILFPARLLATVTAGVLMAVAAMISIKAAIYGPSIAILLLINWRTAEESRGAVLRASIGFCVASGIALLGLYLAHQASLGTAPAYELTDKLSDTGTRMWAPPPSGTFTLTYNWDRTWWMLTALGGLAAIGVMLKAPHRRTGLIVLAMMLPLATLSFYRNSFPYYYICLIPPASLAIGLLASLAPRVLPNRPALAAIIVGLAVLLAGTRTVRLIGLNNDDTVTPQRRVLAAVKRLFPEPVPYIDRCSMVVDYPKLGIFMSTLVSGVYRERGEPVMQSLVESRQPPFILENSPGLNLSLSVEQIAASPYRLLPEDHLYLQKHYLRYWGPIHLAGRQFESTDGQTHSFELPVAGPYSVIAENAIAIDGQTLEPGAVIDLEAGQHTLQGPAGGNRVILRYGRALPQPEGPPLPRGMFTGLGFRNFP